MSTLTKADVALIKTELGRPWGQVFLLCDGHHVRVVMGPARPLTYRPIVLVGGGFDLQWRKAESEVGAKFYQRKRGQFFTRKQIAEHQKRFGKRAAKKLAEEGSYTYHTQIWSSVGGFLRHLNKTCREIELLSVGYPDDAAPSAVTP